MEVSQLMISNLIQEETTVDQQTIIKVQKD